MPSDQSRRSSFAREAVLALLLKLFSSSNYYKHRHHQRTSFWILLLLRTNITTFGYPHLYQLRFNDLLRHFSSLHHRHPDLHYG